MARRKVVCITHGIAHLSDGSQVELPPAIVAKIRWEEHDRAHPYYVLRRKITSPGYVAEECHVPVNGDLLFLERAIRILSNPRKYAKKKKHLQPEGGQKGNVRFYRAGEVAGE